MPPSSQEGDGMSCLPVRLPPRDEPDLIDEECYNDETDCILVEEVRLLVGASAESSSPTESVPSDVDGPFDVGERSRRRDDGARLSNMTGASSDAVASPAMESDRRRQGRRRRGSQDGNRPRSKATAGTESGPSSFQAMLNRSSSIGGHRPLSSSGQNLIGRPSETMLAVGESLSFTEKGTGASSAWSIATDSTASISTASPSSLSSSVSSHRSSLRSSFSLSPELPEGRNEEELRSLPGAPLANGGLAEGRDVASSRGAASPPPSTLRFACRKRGGGRPWRAASYGRVFQDEAGDVDVEAAAKRQEPPWRPKPSHAGPTSAASSAANGAPPSSDPLVLFGFDISPLPPSAQFGICAAGVFGFTVVYGFLQELVSVHIAGRRYALFLASAQFAGYAFWSVVLQSLWGWRKAALPGTVAGGRVEDEEEEEEDDDDDGGEQVRGGGSPLRQRTSNVVDADVTAVPVPCSPCNDGSVPLWLYVGLSLVRSLDLGMTNGAMRFLNYPAKTLVKSSRVAFTMMLGLVIGRKKYRPRDYAAVAMLVLGLGVFLHADATSDAVFHPVGVAMLVVSLICDGIVANWSEVIMRKHSVSQDEFQSHLYSISFVATTLAALLKGELFSGLRDFLVRSGTVEEMLSDDDPGSAATSAWTPARKAIVLVLFSSTGLFGSSCAGAITKRFGALSMSVTSTARKAMTLFLSFAAFSDNRCTTEHVAGMCVFLTALLGKAVCAKRAADEEEVAVAMMGVEGIPKEDVNTEDDCAIAVRGEDMAVGKYREEGALQQFEAPEGGLGDELTSIGGPDSDSEEMKPLVVPTPQQGGSSLFATARRSRRLASLFQWVGVGSSGPNWAKSTSSLSCGDTHQS